MGRNVLETLVSKGGQVTAIDQGWCLSLPAGAGGSYRLAQLDDYAMVPRNRFPWQARLSMELDARASHSTIPGTWGVGLWNDPFSVSLGFGGGTRRLPALPNAAWFFFASPPNYLSLRDDLPAQGALAGTFRSRSLPTPILAMMGAAFPLLAVPRTARLVRRMMRGLVQQEATSLVVDATAWHTYHLEWGEEQVDFRVDGDPVLSTGVAPFGPLGFVVWIDNQFAAFPPDGKLGFGTLENKDPAWIEIKNLQLRGN